MTSSNPILKFALGLFHFLLPFAVLVAFFAALFGIISILAYPIETVIAEILLLSFIVIAGTYASRQSAIEAKQKALDKVRLEQSAGAEVQMDDQEAANAEIPPFKMLLKRNALIAIFLVPSIIVITVVAFGLLMAGTEFAREAAQNKTGFRLLLQPLILAPVLGWMAAIGFVWSRIGKFVDHRILHTTVDLPVDEETRQKRRMWKRESGESTSERIRGFAKIFAFLALFISPILFALWLMNDPNFSEEVKTLIGIAMIIYPFAMMFFLWRYMNARFKKLMEKAAQEAIEAAETPEEAEAIRQELAEDEARRQARKQSYDVRVMQRMQTGFIGLIIGVVVVGTLVGFGARALGADGETAKGVMTAALCLGMVVVVGGAGVILPRFMPKTPHGQKLLEGWEEAMRKADYPKLTKIIDEAMKQLPNWETQIPGAGAYAQMGRLDEAEQIAKAALKELADYANEEHRELRKPIMAHAFGLLAEIYIMSDRLDEAEPYAQRAIEYLKDDYPGNNTMGKLYLYRNQPDEALPHLETAAKAYVKDGKAVSAYNIGLRAWASALKGDFAQAHGLIEQAIKQTPKAHVTDLAELYLIGSYIMKAQNKLDAARRSLEKALIHDRYGVYGIIAQREINGLMP